MTKTDYKCLKCYSIWDLYVWMCRIWGILIVLILWGVGVEGIFVHEFIGAFILIAALIVSFFEGVFIVTFWIDLCSKDESSLCVRVWHALNWVDDWRKTVLYTPLAIICLLYPKQFWLGIIPGVMLLFCALMYGLKSIKTRSEEKEEAKRAKQQTYDKFESDVQEDIEDTAVTGEPSLDVQSRRHGRGDPVDAVSEDSNVGDQEEIIDV